MLRYEKVNLSVPQTTLGHLTITPEGRALAAIPGWRALIDPAYKAPLGNGYRNRAMSRNYLVSASGYVAHSFANGEPAFSSLAAAHANTARADFALNPQEFSFFFVLKRTEAPIPVSSYLLRPIQNPASEDQIGAYIFSSTKKGLVLHNTLPAAPYVYRMILPSVLEQVPGKSDSVLCMFTFSVERGLTGFVNGKEVARNATDKRPLSPGFYETAANRLHQQTSGGDATNPVIYGMHGILDIDLSKPEYTANRYQIEEFLKTKYAII